MIPARRLIPVCLAAVTAGALVFPVYDADALGHREYKDVIHRQTTTAGTGEVSTSSHGYYYYREKCKLHTDIIITPVLHNGHKRNNPDSTFYPGDALEYETRVRVEGCSIVKFCGADVPPNEGQTCTPLEATCRVTRRGGCQHTGFTGLDGSGPSSEGGTAFIPGDIYGPDESYAVTKKTYAMAKVIVTLPTGTYLGYSLVTSEASFPVRVIDPALSVTLSYAPLTDSEGYVSANLDGTYYVWDPINVVHEIDYRWKNERIGTIHATHAKKHGILENVYEYTCEKASCVHTSEGIRGHDPQTLEHGFAGGLTVYNSTCVLTDRAHEDDHPCRQYHGLHRIVYEASLHNIEADSRIRTGEGRRHAVYNSTEPLIVRYDPKFSEPYAYVSLKDGAGDSGSWAWSKRHVVAALYLGSAGGGRDDPGTHAHELRRALFNVLDYSGRALYVTGTAPIEATLRWNATAGPSAPRAERCGEYDEGLVDGAFVFGRNGDSAMFTQAAYGRLYTSYPISDFMRDNNYQTATVYNTVQTSMFAGQGLRDMFSYNYTYPAAQFSVPASLVMTDDDGLVGHGRVSAEIVPIPTRSEDPASDGAPSYLHDRVCENVLEKTGDAEFANMVVSDMYPRRMSVSAESGGRVDYVLNRTGAVFTDVYGLFADRISELDANTIYEAPSAYEFSYAASDGSAVRTRTLTSEVTFTSPLLEIANIYDGNALHHTLSCPACPHTVLQVRPDAGFGRIAEVEHEGARSPAVCGTEEGCTVPAVKGKNNTVTLKNVWGGTATATVFVPATDPAAGLSADPNAVVTAAAVGIAAVIVWRSFGLAMRRLRAVTGA